MSVEKELNITRAKKENLERELSNIDTQIQRNKYNLELASKKLEKLQINK
ncbi:hypothetical protein OM999_01855 [Mycoplasmopsis cynos]|nr:hypothetical protein [Mycoplasmopsis cynos]WAM03909.1 hypothetical protein ONA22_02785 [Mycoplasmopsis cynos]WAM05968.1 hypothetical protein OM999_01855 [Mycoplasmopsis cynos]